MPGMARRTSTSSDPALAPSQVPAAAAARANAGASTNSGASRNTGASTSAGASTNASEHAQRSSQRSALRDPMIVERILERHGARPGLRPILDAPCGTGRLRGVLERRGMRYVGVDGAAAMLREAAGRERELAAGLCVALIDRLPFKDDAFDVVVCCRLLHQLDDAATVETVVRELTRVSYRLVIASFFDAASLPALRRRVGFRRSHVPRGKYGLTKRSLRRMFEAAGAEVIGFHHSLRFVSQQAFVVAIKRCPADERAREVHSLRARFADVDIVPASGSLGGA
jgi:SAM-dependent methyltransferase